MSISMEFQQTGADEKLVQDTEDNLLSKSGSLEERPSALYINEQFRGFILDQINAQDE